MSSVQVSSSFKMVSVPKEVANSAMQSSSILFAAGKNTAPATFAWPQTGFRYSATPIADSRLASPGMQAARAAATVTAGIEHTESGSWAKVTAPDYVGVMDGGTNSMNMVVATITDDKPLFSSTPAGICKVQLGAVSGGTGSNPAGILVTLGALDIMQTEAATGRIKVAHQPITFSAAAGTSNAVPYKVTATAYIDDVGDNCSGDNFMSAWREKIDFTIEILVVNDTFPENETAEKVFTGSADFKVTTNITTSFEPTLSFDQRISGAKLEYARIEVAASPKVVQTLTIAATAQGAMDKTQPIIAPRKFFKVYVTPSGIPIVVSGEFQLDMRITGDVSGALNATEQLTVGYDEVVFGLKYENGIYTPINRATPVYNLKIGGDGKAEANLQISLLPSLQITAYESLTGKVVLEPYLAATAGVEGFVQMDADFDANAQLSGLLADADYRLTKGALTGGTQAWLYADFHIWDYTVVKWPSNADADKYNSYYKINLINETPFLGIPSLSAAVDNAVTHSSDSRAIKVTGTATNVSNPLKNLFSSLPDAYVTWQRWTLPRIIAPKDVSADSYKILPSSTGDSSAVWVVLTQPGTYTVRLGGHTNWGSWARQYTEAQITVTDANNNGIMDDWETKFGITDSGTDPDADGKTNLQEWLAGSNPKMKDYNLPPTAVFFSDAANGLQVSFDASLSSDSDGTIAGYGWDFGDGQIYAGKTVSHTYANAGTYTVTLIVTDDIGATATASASVTVGIANTAPVANAGPDQNVATGAQVTLNGSGSSDANGDTLTYSWSFTSKPAGSAAALSSSTVTNPTFTADKDGAYVLSLIVNDGQVASAADTATITAAPPAPAATGKMPDTNQTTSYTTTFGEDHDYTINPPSYTDNGDGTVTDNVTGLVWQKQDDATIGNWDSAVSYCSNLTLAGHTDWRLPSRIELVSIVDYGIYNPSINATFFSGTLSSRYWSSTLSAAAPYAYVWSVSFGNSYTNANELSTYINAARCVRGGQTTPSLTDNGNGTVTDSGTLLTWQQSESSAMTWEAALTNCEGLSLAGQTDWRLPNIKELSSIVDDTRSNPAINTTMFPNASYSYYSSYYWDYSYYWSSTTRAISTSNAWYVGFFRGETNYYGSDGVKTDSNYVRCVRGGQAVSGFFQF